MIHYALIIYISQAISVIIKPIKNKVAFGDQLSDLPSLERPLFRVDDFCLDSGNRRTDGIHGYVFVRPMGH